MAAPVQNGPAVPAWEKTWSTEEMRKQSTHWNLAGDAGLLQYLQDFSQNMISKTHEMEQLMNSLFHETKVTNSKVSNIINEFHMLSNTQFVESRVYDEEAQDISTEKTVPEEVKSKEQREAEVVAKISEALNFGLSVIDEAFERVEIQQDSDTEDEDDSTPAQVILQPKDPYVHRFLPHMIGSQAFHQDEYVGIGDLSDDEEDSKMEKYDSDEVSSGTESPPLSIKNPPPTGRYSKQFSHEQNDSDSEEDADLFPNKNPQNEDLFHPKDGNSDSDLSSSDFENNAPNDETDRAARDGHGQGGPAGAPLLAEILDAKLRKHADQKIAPKKNRANSRRKSETPSIQSKRSVKSDKSFVKQRTKDSSDEDLFGVGNSDLPEEEENDHFGGRGLFSGTGKLFDDKNDEKDGGLFGEAPKKVTPKEDQLDNQSIRSDIITPRSRGNTKSGKKIPAGAVSILGGDDLFTANSSSNVKNFRTKSVTGASASPQTNPSSAASTEKKLVSETSKIIPISSTNVSNVSAIKSNVSSSTKPSLSGGGGLFDSDEEDEDDLFSTKKVAPASGPVGVKPPTKGFESNLLFESDDEALFSRDKTSSIVQKEEADEVMKEDEIFAKPEKKLPAGAVSMFGSLSKELGAAIHKKQNKPSRPEMDNSDDDSSPSSAMDEENKSRPASGGSFSNKSSSSFNQNNHLNNKTTISKESRSNSVSSNSLFVDDPETDDLFAPFNPTSTTMASNKDNTIAKKEIKSSSGGKMTLTKDFLFEDEDDSLFSSQPFKNKKQPPSFRDQQQQQHGIATTGSSLGANKQSSSIDLFDDFREDEVDSNNLFDGLKANKPTITASANKAKGLSLFEDDAIKPSEIKTTDQNIPDKLSPIEKVVKVPQMKKISLFDDEEDEDDLFSFSSKRSQSPGSFSSSKTSEDTKSPVTVPETKQKLSPQTPPEVSVPEIRKKPFLFDETDLFGDSLINEESPEVDLFTSTLKPSSSSTSAAANNNTKTSVSNASAATNKIHPSGENNFISPKPSEKMSSSTDAVPSSSSTPTSPSVTKPIGGVALFGGVDLFGDHLRKTSTGGGGGGGSTDNSSTLDLDQDDTTTSDYSSSSTTTTIGKRAPMLKDINKEQPSSDATLAAISFDEPVNTSNTLPSASKDRAKVQTKRRPPSRKGRQAAARNSILNLENDRGLLSASSTSSGANPTDAKGATTPTSSPAPKSNNNNADTRDNEDANLAALELPIQQKDANASTTRTSVADSSLLKTNELNLGGFGGEGERVSGFGGEGQRVSDEERKPAKTKTAPLLSVTDDFRSPSTEEEDLFSVSEHLSQQHYVDKINLPSPAKTTLTKDKDHSNSPSAGHHRKETSNKDALKKSSSSRKRDDDLKSSLLEDGDRDRSSSSSPSLSGAKKRQEGDARHVKEQQNVLFEKCVNAPPTNVFKPPNIFGDGLLNDDDDIFSVKSSKTSGITAVASALASPGSVDIFEDAEEDIFKSLPSKTKPKTTSAMASSIFDEDDDDSDIFAPKPSISATSASTGASGASGVRNPQLTVAAKKTSFVSKKKESKKTQDVFEDPLLSLAQKEQ